MGISDDIRRISPRQHISHHKEHVKLDTVAKEPAERENLADREEDINSTDRMAIRQSFHDDFFPSLEEPALPKPMLKKEKKPNVNFLPLIFNRWTVLVLLVVVVIGFAFWKRSEIKRVIGIASKESAENANEEPAVTIIPQDYASETTDSDKETKPATETKESSPKTAPAFDKLSLKIKVLNGNGISNSASLMKSELEKDGYKVSQIGNAKSFSYIDTYIFYKTGSVDAAEALKELLNNKSVKIQNNDPVAGAYNIVLVVGKN